MKLFYWQERLSYTCVFIFLFNGDPKKKAEPEDWTAISVVLQLYGCRMNARKGRAGGHWGEALIAQLLQDKVLNFSGQTVE